jgi:hypothetical protein
MQNHYDNKVSVEEGNRGRARRAADRTARATQGEGKEIWAYGCSRSCEMRCGSYASPPVSGSTRKDMKFDNWRRFQEAVAYPPAAPPAEIFVSTSGSGPHQSGPDRILMILSRRRSFSGIGGAHDRRYPWPAYVQPAEGVACSGVACPEAGLASWG